MTVSFRRLLTTGAAATIDRDLSGCPYVYLMFAHGDVNSQNGFIYEHAGNGENGGPL